MVNFNPTKRCLIVHEELQLGVCPSVVPCPLLVVLLFVVFGMVALETSQVLKRYGLRSDFLCESNQSLACDVENVLRYGFFSSTQPLEEAMSGTSAYAGYLRSGLSNAQTAVVQFATTNIQGHWNEISSSQMLTPFFLMLKSRFQHKGMAVLL